MGGFGSEEGLLGWDPEKEVELPDMGWDGAGGLQGGLRLMLSTWADLAMQCQARTEGSSSGGGVGPGAGPTLLRGGLESRGSVYVCVTCVLTWSVLTGPGTEEEKKGKKEKKKGGHGGGGGGGGGLEGQDELERELQMLGLAGPSAVEFSDDE
eukprot:2614225-Rhodomonas_salina.1